MIKVRVILFGFLNDDISMMPDNEFLWRRCCSFWGCFYSRPASSHSMAANLQGAPRRPNADLIQESFYNGRVHLHEIKHLTCDLPNGIVAFCWGADFVRRNDLFVLSDNQAILHVEQVYEDIPPLEEFC